ncbi:hypothetical protein Tco_0525980 [Tanacetum coccineum]
MPECTRLEDAHAQIVERSDFPESQSLCRLESDHAESEQEDDMDNDIIVRLVNEPMEDLMFIKRWEEKIYVGSVMYVQHRQADARLSPSLTNSTSSLCIEAKIPEMENVLIRCMRTRSKARRLQQQQQVPPNLVEPPKDTMADNRTMAELLQAPTEGYEDAIVVPEIHLGRGKEDCLTGLAKSIGTFPTFIVIDGRGSITNAQDSSAFLYEAVPRPIG